MAILNGTFYYDGPFSVPGNEIQILFTGRIDNRRELLASFKNSGMPPVEQDEEILSNAYTRWGTSFPSLIRGDFAIAVLDGRKKQVVLARDPLGSRALYYHADPKRIIFSSRINLLFKDPSVPQKPCELMLGQFFTGEFLDYEDTFFENIKQVPPAHVLIVKKDGQLEKKRYGSLDFGKTRIYRDKNQYLEEFYSLFETSVRSRIQGTSPVGLLLSGGLDSTQICGMAETLRQTDTSLPPVKPICLFAEGFLIEDKTALDRLRERYQTDIEILDYRAMQKSKSLFELYLEPGETPYYDAFMTAPALLERFAAKDCKVLLTGYGANEFSNLMEFGYLQDLLLGLRFGKLSREAKRFAQCIDASSAQVMRMIFFEALREKTPFFVRSLIRRRRLQKRNWLRPEFRKKISTCPPRFLRPFGNLAQDETYHALFEPQIPLNLTQMEEAAGRFGMEIRHPFMDMPLIEFFLSIPPEIKMEGGYRKNFIQRSLAPIVPFPVRDRDDERPYIPFPSLEARKNLERSRLQGFLSDPRNLIYEYVDDRVIQTMLSSNQGFLNFPLLWRLVRLESWLQTYWGKTNDFMDPNRYNFVQQAT